MRSIRQWLLWIGLVALAPAAAPGQTMVEGMHFTFAPAEYSLPAPPILGPGKAKGLILWNHGRGQTAASDKASPLAFYFAEQGWDVYSLYRNWGNDDRRRAQQIVQIGVEKGQAMGYRRILLMGQSAGAFASVEAVRYGAEVEAVIATAPAAYGSIETPKNDWRENDLSMRELWQKFQGKHVKVAVAYFNGDPYFEAGATNVRGPWV